MLRRIKLALLGAQKNSSALRTRRPVGRMGFTLKRERNHWAARGRPQVEAFTNHSCYKLAGNLVPNKSSNKVRVVHGERGGELVGVTYARGD
jgi:hypothetical protein